MLVPPFTPDEMRQLAVLAEKARRATPQPSLAGRFEAAAHAATLLLERHDRDSRLADLQVQLAEVKRSLPAPQLGI